MPVAYDPAVQLAEIMRTELTCSIDPRPDIPPRRASCELDGDWPPALELAASLDGLEALDGSLDPAADSCPLTST